MTFSKRPESGRIWIERRMLPTELSRKFRVEKLVFSKNGLVRYDAYDLVHFRVVSLTIIYDIDVILRARIATTLNTLSQINHPNALPIFEHGILEKYNLYYWTTPRVNVIPWLTEIPGHYTKSKLKNEICKLITDVFNSLEIAHQQHVFHGSICPSVIVRHNGHYCLMDFGLPSRDKSSRIVNKDARNIKITRITNTDQVPNIYTDLQGVGSCIKEIIEPIKEESVRKDAQFQQIESFILQLIEGTPDIHFKSAKQAKNEFTKILSIKTDTLEGIQKEIEVTYPIEGEPVVVQSEAIVRKMPLLAKASISMDKSMFRNLVVLHINHCAEDLFILNQVLSSLGATVIFVAVPYGNSSVPWPLPYVVYHSTYSQEGFKLYKNNDPFKGIVPNFENAVGEMVTAALQDEIKPMVLSMGKHLVIIEDGGYHYNILDNIKAKFILPPKSLIGAIEQTASGSKRCVMYSKTKVLTYPVITVARSDVKMRFEPYFIARRIVDELNFLLYQSNDFLSFREVIVIGYGIIGRSIAFTLRSMDCKISVVDTDSEICNLAKKEGFQVFENIPPYAFDRRCIVIGATGESSFSLLMLSNFLESESPNLYLASASSKRVEFADLIDFFESSFETRNLAMKTYPILSKITNIEIEISQIGIIYHFKYQEKRKSIVMIAEGYPVNFYRPHTISLTPTIMDPIITEIALCCEHLVRFSNDLKHNIYLLGSSQIPNMNIDEEKIVSEWLKLNELTQSHLNISAWSYFKIHPLENRLRAKCLGIDIKSL
jgi:S-adenosylhomocysteine hydrolase